MDNIIHKLPLQKVTKERFVWGKPCMKNRLTENDFEKFQQATEQAPKNQACIEMLKSGKNFKTNRQIKVNGPTYKKLMKELIVPLLFMQHVQDKLGNKTQDQYLEESVQIKRTWEQKETAELAAIDQYNLEVVSYNAEVKVVIEKILQLTTWDEFIEFNGVKYGLPPKEGHLTLDCDGRILVTEYSCSCHRCENWGWCGSDGTRVKWCEKCGCFESSERSGSMRPKDFVRYDYNFLRHNGQVWFCLNHGNTQSL